MERPEKQDIYTRITSQIVSQLEKGVTPWVRPWNAEHAAGRITRPLRHNGKPYSGINVLSLWASAMAQNFCGYVSRLLLGHSFGVFPAPGGTRSSASHSAPLWGHGSSQNKFENHGKERPQTSFGSLPESRPSALGSRTHSLSSAQCDPSNNGRIQQTETLSPFPHRNLSRSPLS
jgi:hypothetical protein